MSNSIDVSQPQRLRLPTAEAEAKAQVLLKLTDDLVGEYIMDHPFTRRLEAGDLPLEIRSQARFPQAPHPGRGQQMRRKRLALFESAPPAHL